MSDSDSESSDSHSSHSSSSASASGTAPSGTAPSTSYNKSNTHSNAHGSSNGSSSSANSSSSSNDDSHSSSGVEVQKIGALSLQNGEQPLTGNAALLFLLPAVCWIVLAAASVGFVLHMSFIEPPGPTLVVEHSGNAWAAALCAYFAYLPTVLVIYVPCLGHPSSRRRTLVTVWLIVVTSLFFVYFITSAIAGAGWQAVWALCANLVGDVCIGIAILGDTSYEGDGRGRFLTLMRLKFLVIFSCCNSVTPDAGTFKARALSCWNYFNLCLLTVFLVFLTFGAAIAAHETTRFGPTGEFVDVQLNDGSGRTYTIMFDCKGDKSDFGTVILEQDGSHGAPDMWPLQEELVDEGFRVCVSDKPGLGYSSYRYTDVATDDAVYYSNFIDAMDENKPYTLVGWGGGGSIIYDYARSAKNGTVAGLVFLGTYGEGVEFRFKKEYEELSEEEALEARAREMKGRGTLFRLIRGLAVPWGLAGLFNPPREAYALEDKYAEFVSPYKLPKTWVTQYMFFRDFLDQAVAGAKGEDKYNGYSTAIANKGVYGKPPKNADGLPLLQIYPAQPLSKVCYETDSQETCKWRKAMHKFLIDDAIANANVTNNPTVYPCTEDDCSLGFPRQYPGVVLDGLRAWYNVSDLSSLF